MCDAYQIKELTDASKELQDEKDSITRVGCRSGGWCNLLAVCVERARACRRLCVSVSLSLSENVSV